MLSDYSVNFFTKNSKLRIDKLKINKIKNKRKDNYTIWTIFINSFLKENLNP